MKIACIQMDMLPGRPAENFPLAERLIRQAADGSPDVIVLPEVWNTGFFPRADLAALSDRGCAQTQAVIGALARELSVNIVAGSVSNLRGGQVYNTACVFDRTGAMIAQYDKTHLFSPAHEQDAYTPGTHVCSFCLDGVHCGLVICYDIRFPELVRTLAVQGMDMLFVPAQWPAVRIAHLRALTTARAIENQCFVVCCNSCGTTGKTRYGGASAIIDPWGETLALAGADAEILTAACDLSVLQHIRSSIDVFHDRRPELYRLGSAGEARTGQAGGFGL